jgi:decaprenyl-phosphate phosphoribosyltransferase
MASISPPPAVPANSTRHIGAVPDMRHVERALPFSRTTGSTLRAYVAILRPDHWFKNVFMLIGVMLACFYRPGAFGATTLARATVGLVATCLVASSNYVLNELLDAPTDLHHAEKRHRPIPSGLIWLPAAYAEWVALGAAGIFLATRLNRPFAFSALALLIMGFVYNVRPVRAKDVAFVDVLTESVNNPIRLTLGWFAVTASDVPPVCLLGAYWMIGAFFMASKRFAEYRAIGNPAAAAAYRKSFAFYDEESLLCSMFFYATTFALLLGIFIIRYHFELVLLFPLIAGFLCYYLRIALQKDSPCQSPERLHRERLLMLYLIVCVVAFVALMFVHIQWLYSVFNVEAAPVSPLWRF